MIIESRSNIVDDDAQAAVVSVHVDCATLCPKVCGQQTDTVNRQRYATCGTHSPSEGSEQWISHWALRVQQQNKFLVFNTRDKDKLKSVSRETSR